jgi:hypothetical protein
MEAKQLLQSISSGTRELIDQHRQLTQRMKSFQHQLETQKNDLQQLAVDKETLIKENRVL